MIEMVLKKPQARFLLKVLHGPSVSDPKAAELYEYVASLLENSTPKAPWRKVVRGGDSQAYRGNGAAAYLYLECGHAVRELNTSRWEIDRSIANGATLRRRCHECAGMASRNAKP